MHGPDDPADEEGDPGSSVAGAPAGPDPDAPADGETREDGGDDADQGHQPSPWFPV